ncbi:TPA: glycosyltransferase [Clostridioides difficile]
MKGKFDMDYGNSKEYWNRRFITHDWEKNNGREQSIFFYRLAISLIPEWIKKEINENGYSICDLGCAQGDGTNILYEKFQNSDIYGVDFSEDAIELSKSNFNNINFYQEDIVEFNNCYDVLFSSNTLEHFKEPFKIINELVEKSRCYTILLLPLNEKNLIEEHEFEFTYEKIPLKVNKSCLVYYDAVDCRNIENTEWFGEQVLLIYSTKKDEELKRYTLKHLIENTYNSNLNKRLVLYSEEKSKIEKNNTNLNKTIKELENNNTNLNKTIKELENSNTNLNKLIKELENNNTNLSKDNSILFNKLDYMCKEIDNISMLKSYRIAHATRRFKFQFLKGNVTDKVEFFSWIFRKLKKLNLREEKIYNVLEELKRDVLNNKLDLEHSELDLVNDNKNILLLKNLIDSHKFKGIIVYPHAVKWEPMQRPHHILREFARKGYVCIFVDVDLEKSSKDILYERKYENLYIVYDSIALAQVLSLYYPIIMCTWPEQLNWINLVPNKFLWYDILDNLDLFDRYDNNYEEKHRILLQEANFVSYTASNLKRFTEHRTDAKLLANRVNLEDFNKKNTKKIESMENIKNSNIIGYFGAIEEWFDTDIIIELASKNIDFEIVIIGNVSIDVSDFDKYKNVHFLGQVPYNELNNYYHYFDVCIIPFKVNEITNCVSPVKFFEYCALGKPIVCTGIAEVIHYKSETVFIAKDKFDFNLNVRKALDKSVINLANEKNKLIAKENTWNSLLEEFMKFNLSYELLKTNSNLITKDKVIIYTQTFLDMDGYNFYAGGAERYLIDLADLFKDYGIDITIFQYGRYSWVRKFKNINIISLAYDSELDANPNEYIEEFAKRFYYKSMGSLLTIYSPFFISGAKVNQNSIGISHGVAWDKADINNDIFLEKNKNIITAGKILDNIVSVDTNTANWFQTIDYNIGKKMKVIPNYVDVEEFIPREFSSNGDKIIISYPRRLYEARGLYLVLDILDDILTNYQNVEFHFVGRGFKEDTIHVENKIKKWGERVKWYSLLPEEMPKVYKISDIVLIPTMFSEGTSLSCLEAMATGNAIIATRVGGLTDLIIDKFNGRLIDLDENILRNAISELIEDKETRLRYSKNAIQVSKAFNKKIWNDKWKELISSMINLDKYKKSTKELYIKIYIDKENINNHKVIEIIKSILEKDCFISIKTNLDVLDMEKFSYGRLQFESMESDNYYDNPDYIIGDSEKANMTLEEFYKVLTI